MWELFTCAPDCHMCRPHWWAAGWGWCLEQDLEKPDREGQNLKISDGKNTHIHWEKWI